MTEEEKPDNSGHSHDHDNCDHDHDHDHDHAQSPSDEHTKDMTKDEVFALHTEHALMHMGENDLPGSWEHFNEALKIAEGLKDNAAIASTLNSMGHILLMTNDAGGALDHYTRGLAKALESGDSKETARSYHNLGTYYEKEKDYALSIENLLISLAYQKDAGIDSKDTQNYLQDIRKTVKYSNFKETATKVYEELPADIQKKVDIDEFTRDMTIRLVEPRTGRNDPCTCGSGKKYKKCCGLM
jgi:tetratricopeptide (TPR) repeat protein